jgi:hypothetical protein
MDRRRECKGRRDGLDEHGDLLVSGGLMMESFEDLRMSLGGKGSEGKGGRIEGMSNEGR